MSGYDFSPLYHATQTSFSPGSTFLATSYQNRLIVRSTHNLSIVRTWELSPPSGLQGEKDNNLNKGKEKQIRIDDIQWSDDGLYILAFVNAEGAVWVFGLAEEGNGANGEVVRIISGLEGMSEARWVKGGREILCWAEHLPRLTVHDITTGQSGLINGAKSSSQTCTYSPDNRYFAIVERHNNKEHVGVYDAASKYQLTRHFPLQTTDAQQIDWSSCGKFISVAEGWLSYAVYVHSPIGPLISTLTPASPSFQSKVGSSSIDGTEDTGLGVKTMSWAAGGQRLLVGGWDGKVRVIDPVSGRCHVVLSMTRRVPKNVTVWHEPSGWLKDTRGRGISQFDRLLNPPLMPSIQPNLTADPPLGGISHLLPSPSGSHFAIIPATQPSVVHLYDLGKVAQDNNGGIKETCRIMLSQQVKAMKWTLRGEKERLMVVGKSGAVYVWDKEGWVDEEQDAARGNEEGQDESGVVEGVGIPNITTTFAPHDLHVSPDGSSFIVQSKKEFCVMYDDEEEEVKDVNDNYHAQHQEIQDRIANAEKEWETEGLSLVEETEEDDGGEVGRDGSDYAAARSVEFDRPRRMGKRSGLKGRAWRPSDAYGLREVLV